MTLSPKAEVKNAIRQRDATVLIHDEIAVIGKTAMHVNAVNLCRIDLI